MAFPLSTIFQSITGPFRITVTADAAGAPEIIHFVDEAGTVCVHFAIHEWDTIGEHVAQLLHTELESATNSAHTEAEHEISGGTLTDPPAAVTPTAPFLAPGLDEAPTNKDQDS